MDARLTANALTWNLSNLMAEWIEIGKAEGGVHGAIEALCPSICPKVKESRTRLAQCKPQPPGDEEPIAFDCKITV
jgi:hypothetical protein